MLNVSNETFAAADFVNGSYWKTQQDFKALLARAAYQFQVPATDIELVLDYQFTQWAASRGIDY